MDFKLKYIMYVYSSLYSFVSVLNLSIILKYDHFPAVLFIMPPFDECSFTKTNQRNRTQILESLYKVQAK